MSCLYELLRKNFKKTIKVAPVVCNMCFSGITHLTKKECGHYLCTKCMNVGNENNIQCVVCYKAKSPMQTE